MSGHTWDPRVCRNISQGQVMKMQTYIIGHGGLCSDTILEDPLLWQPTLTASSSKQMETPI